MHSRMVVDMAARGESEQNRDGTGCRGSMGVRGSSLEGAAGAACVTEGGQGAAGSVQSLRLPHEGPMEMTTGSGMDKSTACSIALRICGTAVGAWVARHSNKSSSWTCGILFCRQVWWVPGGMGVHMCGVHVNTAEPNFLCPLKNFLMLVRSCLTIRKKYWLHCVQSNGEFSRFGGHARAVCVPACPMAETETH